MSPRLIIGWIARNESEMLHLSLPKIMPYTDGGVAIDAESADSTVDQLHKECITVETRAWTNNYADARNACIALGRKTYPDATMLMLDADECLTARDFAALRDAITDTPCLALPRYEFVDDFYHFNPVFYPDWQCRVFPLSAPYHYVGVIHEQLMYGDEPGTAYQNGRCVPCPYIHIFHYGKAKPAAELWLKYENYNRLSAHMPVLDAVPAGTVIPASFSHGPKLFFHGDRPL